MQSVPEKVPKTRWKKVLLWVGGSFLGLAVAGVLFIKLDTTAAANFTDNVLRPILGANRVIALEKVFFNASDSVQRVQYKNKTPDEPQFIDGGVAAQTTNVDLKLDPIPVLAGLKPIKNEGVWYNKPLSQFPNKEVMAYTFTRPDVDRSFALVTLLKVNMSLMTLGSVAGIKQPGGPVGKPGPGMIPKSIVAGDQLVAAFDGGFQYRDGAYGMIVGDTTYLPLQNDLGTIVGYTNGTLKIVKYEGQDLGKNIAFIRQNCPILIDGGNITVLDEVNKKLWGRTLTSEIYTWRSGIGLDAQGNLVFAVGNNLTPDTLAIALKSAGAVEAIQLDINPNWVRFNIFQPTTVPGTYTSKPLTSALKDGTSEYLGGNPKDFFYIYKK